MEYMTKMADNEVGNMRFKCSMVVENVTVLDKVKLKAPEFYWL